MQLSTQNVNTRACPSSGLAGWAPAGSIERFLTATEALMALAGDRHSRGLYASSRSADSSRHGGAFFAPDSAAAAAVQQRETSISSGPEPSDSSSSSAGGTGAGLALARHGTAASGQHSSTAAEDAATADRQNGTTAAAPSVATNRHADGACSQPAAGAPGQQILRSAGWTRHGSLELGGDCSGPPDRQFASARDMSASRGGAAGPAAASHDLWQAAQDVRSSRQRALQGINQSVLRASWHGGMATSAAQMLGDSLQDRVAAAKWHQQVRSPNADSP